MDPAREIAELLERLRELALHLLELPACGRVLPDFLLEQAELEREGDEPLLRSVVQVPFQALALFLAGLDCACTRASYLLEACRPPQPAGGHSRAPCRRPRRQRRAAPARRREPGRAEAPRLGCRSARSRLLLSRPRRAPRSDGRRGRRSSRTPAASTRAYRRVAERASDGFPEVGRRRTLAQLDEQLSHRRTRKARVAGGRRGTRAARAR